MDEIPEAPLGSGTAAAQAMSRLMRALGRNRAQIAFWSQSQGLNWSALMVLGRLVQAGPRRSSDIAEALCLDPSWISRQVAQLVRHGLVERRADQWDGRVSILAATPEGEHIFAQLQRSMDHYLASRLAHWSEQDRRQLTMLLGRLADEIEVGARSEHGSSDASRDSQTPGRSARAGIVAGHGLSTPQGVDHE